MLRLYRVRRGKVPGTFYYTVLDNGVTSAEYWRILGAFPPSRTVHVVCVCAMDPCRIHSHPANPTCRPLPAHRTDVDEDMQVR